VQSGIAKCVTFQLKSHPTFVSDALEKDLLETVEHYANLDKAEFPNAAAAGATWRDFIAKGQWLCVEDNFWVQAFSMWDMTEPLRSDMAQRCDLAFVKGDANYRRLLGDRMWDYTAPFADVVGCYFPCPVCALRTLKAEIGCGMEPEQVERAKQLDGNWMVNGRFGVVHFGEGASTMQSG
jgi:Damage-control phosphatase ARMT1-like domain